MMDSKNDISSEEFLIATDVPDRLFEVLEDFCWVFSSCAANILHGITEVEGELLVFDKVDHLNLACVVMGWVIHIFLWLARIV